MRSQHSSKKKIENIYVLYIHGLLIIQNQKTFDALFINCMPQMISVLCMPLSVYVYIYTINVQFKRFKMLTLDDSSVVCEYVDSLARNVNFLMLNKEMK